MTPTARLKARATSPPDGADAVLAALRGALTRIAGQAGAPAPL
jgi:hypothetical protein